MRTDDARSAGRGAVALGVFQSGGRVLALGFFVIATHVVSPSDFGRYSTVAAILLIVGFVSDLGTTTATTKLVSTGTDSDQLLADSLLACLLLGLAAWVLGEAIVALGYSSRLAIDFAVLGASLPVDACLTTIIGALDGSGAIARRAVVSFLRVGLGAIVASILIWTTGSIRWAMAGLVSGSVVALVYGAAITLRLGLWRGRVRLDPRRGWPLVKWALPFAAISGLAVVNARIDVVVVSRVASSATTAAYDVAVRVLEGPLFLITVLSGPMLYLFSRRLADGDVDGAQRAYDQVVRLFYVVGLAISVVLTTLAAPLILLAFGRAYHRADTVLAIFGSQLWLMFVTGLQGMVLAALPRMRKAVVLIAAVNGIQVALQVVFIVVGGIVGGAISYSLGSVVAAAGFAMFLRRETGLRTLRLPPLGAIVGAVGASVAALALRRHPLAVPLVGAGAVYALSLLAFRTFGAKDLRDLRQLLGRT